MELRPPASSVDGFNEPCAIVSIGVEFMAALEFRLTAEWDGHGINWPTNECRDSKRQDDG